VPVIRSGAAMKTLTAILQIEGKDYLMQTPQVAGIPARELGPVVGDRVSARATVNAAVDFLFSGFQLAQEVRLDHDKQSGPHGPNGPARLYCRVKGGRAPRLWK